MRPFSPPLPARLDSNLPVTNVAQADLICTNSVGSLGGESSAATMAYNARLVLPIDILFMVFMECDAVTLARCRKVCRNFNAFITNQRTLLYKLALALERQVDTSESYRHRGIPDNNASRSSPLSSMEKLQRLRRQGLAWRGELPPALKVEIPVTRPDSIYELNGGIFALGDTNGGTTGIGVGAFTGAEPPHGLYESNRLDFVKLPSVITGNLGVEWGHINLGTKILVTDFTMNVEMDLLVLIEREPVESSSTAAIFRVHLLSLSRSAIALEPHPLAKVPVLEHPAHPDWAEYQTDFAMNGDHVGLLLNSGQPTTLDRLIIWDWKNGTKAAKHAEEDAFASFAFIREGLVLLPDFDSPSLDLFSYTLEADLGSFQMIMSFKLPSLIVGLEYMYIMLRTQPTGQPNREYDNTVTPKSEHAPPPTIKPEASDEGDDFDPSSSQNPPSPLDAPFSPFSPSIDDAIVVVSLGIVPTQGNNSWVDRVIPDGEGTLVIKKSTFRKWLQNAEQDAMVIKNGNHEAEAAKTVPDVAENADVIMTEQALEEATPLQGACSAPGESEELSLETPLHRSQGVQTSPEPPSPRSTSSVTSYPKVLPWRTWMYETRWLRNKEAPRWIRDVYGMRFASRVLAVPSILPPSQNPPAGAYQTGAIGDLPSMGQILQAYSSYGLPAPTFVVPPEPTEDAAPPIPPAVETPLPSISELFTQQPAINPTNPASMPLPTPVEATPDLQEAVFDSLMNPRYRTRICDFNLHPYNRVPRSIPYPGNVKVDLSVDYSELGFPNSPSSRLTPIQETESPELTDVQVTARRNALYLKKKKKADGSVTSDRGWSVIQGEKGLEWVRRPVWDDTVIPAGVTFAERICTGMAYLEITSRFSNACTALMMDAERILAMETEDGTLRSIHVTVI